MTIPRLLAVIGIFFCAMIAWFILGGSIAFRTQNKTTLLGQRVEDNWGGEHIQMHPQFFTIESVIDTASETLTSASGQITRVKKTSSKKIKRYLEPNSAKVHVTLKVDYRKKGLLWYSVYQVEFKGDYGIINSFTEPKNIFVEFHFPSANSIYDHFVFTLDGKPILSDDQPLPAATGQNETEKPFTRTVETSSGFQPNEQKTFSIGYTSQGTGIWKYSFGETTKRIRNFQLTINTLFKDYDIPEFCISPTEITETAEGWNLIWTYSDMISNIKIGVDMPKKLNPGPVAERISFFAPVSLLFFFTILLIIGAIKNILLHPMHYFFLAAAFFSFHLFFAYLVDHLPLEGSFVISGVTSLFLVMSYLWRVTGKQFALQIAVPAQIVYLILFSYTFFFEGYTGLTITIGAILTLFFLMQISAKVNWTEIFAKQ